MTPSRGCVSGHFIRRTDSNVSSKSEPSGILLQTKQEWNSSYSNFRLFVFRKVVYKIIILVLAGDSVVKGDKSGSVGWVPSHGGVSDRTNWDPKVGRHCRLEETMYVSDIVYDPLLMTFISTRLVTWRVDWFSSFRETRDPGSCLSCPHRIMVCFNFSTWNKDSR